MAETRDELGRMNLTNDTEEMNDPDIIRANIEQTRAQMSETVDTIHARLSPENLKQQAQEAIREATVGKVKEMADNVEHTVRGWRSNVMSTIRQNPVPAAMVAIGVGWLLMSGESDEYTTYDRSRYQRSYPYGYTRGYDAQSARSQAEHRGERLRETVNETMSEVKSNVQETAEHARERVEQMSEQVQQRASEWADQAEYQARRAKQGFNQMMTENPLAVGAAALAIGATIGLLLPATQRENELMGPARDRFVEKAQATAQQTMESVSEVVKEDIREVTEKTGNDKNRSATPNMGNVSGAGQSSGQQSWRGQGHTVSE